MLLEGREVGTKIKDLRFKTIRNTKPERVIGRQRLPIRKEKERQKETKRDENCRIDTCVYWMLASE